MEEKSILRFFINHAISLFSILVCQTFDYKMSSIVKVIADFYPKRMYRGPSLMQLVKQIYDDGFYEYAEIIVARNNVVRKLACGYCVCYCKTFSLVLDSTECTKNYFTEECSILSVPPKIK